MQVSTTTFTDDRVVATYRLAEQLARPVALDLLPSTHAYTALTNAVFGRDTSDRRRAAEFTRAVANPDAVLAGAWHILRQRANQIAQDRAAAAWTRDGIEARRADTMNAVGRAAESMIEDTATPDAVTEAAHRANAVRGGLLHDTEIERIIQNTAARIDAEGGARG